MKKIIAFLLLVSLCVGLCACGTSKQKVESDLQGHWEYSWYASAVGLYCYSYYEFDSGTVNYTFIRGTSTTVEHGTYEITGSQVIVTIDGSVKTRFDYSYEGDRLTLVNNGDGTIHNVYTKFA